MSASSVNKISGKVCETNRFPLSRYKTKERIISLIEQQLNTYEIALALKDNTIIKLKQQLRIARLRNRDYRKGIKRLKRQKEHLKDKVERFKEILRWLRADVDKFKELLGIDK